MPSLKTIRKRIGTVRSTQKITKAMKMVAGARLARAQAAITARRPFAEKTEEMLREVTASAIRASNETDVETEPEPLHPYLQTRAEKKALIVVLTSDRGLCGGFNANVLRALSKLLEQKSADGIECVFGTCGRRGRDWLRRRGMEPLRHFADIFDGIDDTKVYNLSSWVSHRFLKEEVDSVYIIYNEFRSAITQKVRVDKVFPLTPDAAVEADDGARPGADKGRSAAASATATQGRSGTAAGQTTEFAYEPSRDAALEWICASYLFNSIYRALLDSIASEHGARMSAMDAATRNASDLISRLTLQYNRARQASITKELMEIIGGAEALNG
jgi:F-type H+-transporting ATPase subunit gamma